MGYLFFRSVDPADRDSNGQGDERVCSAENRSQAGRITYPLLKATGFVRVVKGPKGPIFAGRSQFSRFSYTLLEGAPVLVRSRLTGSSVSRR